jgi:hypothetical protein
MPEHYEDLTLSTVEDLDPDPPARGRPTFVRELMLGLVLLLAVLGWAGWQSWQQQSRQDDYRLAQLAASQHNWDEARDRYLAASGYKDSDAHAEEAVRLIHERDQQYQAAVNNANKKQWAVALAACRAASSIQPNYRDLNTISAEAQKQVYAEALSGTVALRTQADPPGLYYRTGDAWVWLQGSDKWSSVLGQGTPDRIIYDVPGSGLNGPQAQNPLPEDTSSRLANLRGRLLVVASVGGPQLTYHTLALDPSDYSYFLPRENGVWAASTQRNAIIGDVRYGYAGFSFTYEPYGSPITKTISPLHPEVTLLDFDRSGDHILFVEPSESHTNLDVYIADADGSNRRLIYSHAAFSGASKSGGIQSGQFSPDGRYVLLTVYGFLFQANRYENQSTILITLDNEIQHTLAGTTMAVPSGPIQPNLSSAFLERDGRPLLALIKQPMGWGDTLRAFNMDDLSSPLTFEVGDGPAESAWASWWNSEQAIVISRQTGFDPAAGFSELRTDNTLSVVVMAPNKAPSTADIPLTSRAFVTLPAIRDDRLVYQTQVFDSPNGQAQRQIAISSVPLSAIGSGHAIPSTVYTTTEALEETPSYGLGPSHSRLGAGLLAYTAKGDLHVRTYDGKIDLVLESGIDGFYDPRQSDGVASMR